MAATTPVKRNRALVTKLYDELATMVDDGTYRELYSEDVVVHNVPGSDDDIRGLDALETYFRGLLETFPDLEVTVEAMAAEDDVVAARNTYTGTHEGTFMGVPATGERVTFDGMVFFRVEAGKIAETWGRIDTLGLMQQLGVTEVPAA